MVVLTGWWLKGGYVSSWELWGDSDHKWNNVNNVMSQQVAAKPTSKITSVRLKEIMKDQNETSVRQKFCALIPNERTDESKKGKSNRLNVLMVSVYQNNSGLMSLNFRTFVKDDTSTWLPVMDNAQPAAGASTSASSSAPKLVLVRWEDGTETTVPSSFFIPPSTDYNGDDTMQVIKASDNPVNSKLKTGSVLPAIPPYKWQQGWSTSTKKGDFKYTSDFRPQTPSKDYVGYEAIAGDRNRSNHGRKCQVRPNPRWKEGILELFDADNHYFRDEMGFNVWHHPEFGYKEQPNLDTDGAMVAEYFFDTTTNRPYAILYKLSRSYRYRVTNPAEIFKGPCPRSASWYPGANTPYQRYADRGCETHASAKTSCRLGGVLRLFHQGPLRSEELEPERQGPFPRNGLATLQRCIPSGKNTHYGGHEHPLFPRRARLSSFCTAQAGRV